MIASQLSGISPSRRGIMASPESLTGAILPRIDSIRSEILRLIHAVPFRRFALSMENGERALIEHPENIAFDPNTGGSDEFYVISGKLRLFSTFGAVSGVILGDRDGAAA
jgi:hypothetical protein